MAFDVLRGFAFLGFVPLLVQDMSLVAVQPGVTVESGVLTGLDGVIWIFLSLFFDETFVALLSLLFGAGFMVMRHTLPDHDAAYSDAVYSNVRAFYSLTARLRYLARAKCATPIMARRVFFLLLCGLGLHFLLGGGLYLLILALCAIVIILLRHGPPERFVKLGLVAIFVQCGLLILLAYGASTFDWGIIRTYAAQEAGLPFNDNVGLLSATKESWGQAVLWRLQPVNLAMGALFVLQNGLRILGLCLIGGAFAHWRDLEEALPTSRYAQWMAVSALVGLPLGVLGIMENISHSWDPLYTLGLGAQFTLWSSLTIGTGLLSAVMIACRYKWFERITKRLAAIGRLSLSHGVLVVLTLVWLFQGVGLSWAGKTDRLDNMQITACLWAFQILVSVSWLRYFHFGPIEWLARRVSYRMALPFANVKRLFA